MVALGEFLNQRTQSERIDHPETERFATIKLRGGGMVPRKIGAGKTPAKFTGYRLCTGDFVYSRIDARNGAFAIVPELLHDAVVSKDFPVFEIDESLVDVRYWSHYFKHPKLAEEIQRKLAFGATNRQRVSEDAFLGLKAPLPPLEEQRRIADLLDRAATLEASAQSHVDRITELEQATFTSFFGRPSRMRENFPERPLGDLLVSAQYGTSAKATLEGDVPVLRMGNVTYSGRLDVNDLKYVDAETARKYDVVRGDVLFNRTNSPDLVGKTTVYDRDNPMSFAGYLIRLRTTDTLNATFLASWFNMPDTKTVLKSMCKTIVGMANINAKEVQAMRIAVPPIDLQRRFVEQLQAIRRHETYVSQSVCALRDLNTSLADRAFKGEL